METQFVPSQIATKLKELNFDLPCFTTYVKGELNSIYNVNPEEVEDCLLMKNDNPDLYCKNSTLPVNYFAAPLYQQVTEWLRDYHNIHIDITPELMSNLGNFRSQPY